MTDRNDGPWDAPTTHDDPDEIDDGDMSGDDPPTMRASDQQRARARSAAIANQLAGANQVARAPTLPPPLPVSLPPSMTPVPPPLPSMTLPPPVVQRQPAKPSTLGVGSEDNPVVLLDRVSASVSASVSGSASTAHAPRRSESAAGGVVVVATGADGERMRKLCHKHGLLVPVMGSLAVVHDAMSVVVIGEPSPPAPERVVHVARPSLPDDLLIDLLRSLVGGRAIVEPPQVTAATVSDARVVEATRRLASLTDRGAIEMITIETITALTAADRAHCLFHDPSTGALWSEARRRNGRDDRQAMGGFVGWAAQTGQTIHASPAGDDPRWLQELDDPEGKPQSRLLVRPIIGADRRVHAVLVAVRRWRHADFSPREIQALASFAALAGPALDLAVGKPMAVAAPVVAPQPVRFAPAVRAEESTRVDDPPTALATPDERFSSDSITGLPSPPAVAPRPPTAPRPMTTPPPAARAMTTPPAPRPTTPPAPSPVPVAEKPAPARARTANDSQQHPQPKRVRIASEPRDLAVVANEEDAKRVRRIAKKARLEVSTFGLLAEAPSFYQVVTIGEAWSPGADHRIAYAARTAIPDEQLADLLAALTTGHAVAAAPSLLRVQSSAEARRSQLAFVAARKLAATTDLVVAEELTTNVVRELLDSDRAYCCFVDPDTGALWSEARRRAGGDDRRAIAGIAGWAARTGHAVNAPHASTDPRWLGPIDDPDGDPHSQLLVQPLIRTDERVHGVLIAARRARRPGFTETDAALFARFAALVTPLLEQLVIFLDTQQLVENTSAQSSLTTAAEPVGDPPRAQSEAPLIVHDSHPLTRWIYLALGMIVGLIIGLLV
jgi:GAF domain-containing protein